jgi:hypothetical protein
VVTGYHPEVRRGFAAPRIAAATVIPDDRVPAHNENERTGGI